jgi:trigger factor
VSDELKVTVEEPTAVTRTLTVEVPAAEVDRARAATLREYRRKAVMPGFRRGKVPADVVQRMYAGDIATDVARALVSSSFDPALAKVALEAASEPEFEILTLEEGQPFVFTAKFELRPHVEPKDYLGIEVSGESVDVKDEEVDHIIEELRVGHATVRKAEGDRGVRDGDVAVITFEGKVEGAPVPGGAGQDFPLVVGSNAFPPGFEDNLIGAKAGEEREFTIRLPEQFGEAALAGKEALFRVTVSEVRERILPELDDAFAKDVGDYQGLADLREKIAVNIRGSKAAAARGRLREAVLSKLVEANPLAVPPSMLERRKAALVADAERYLVMRGVPWAEVQKQRPAIVEDAGPAAERKVRASLILEAIAEREQVQVTEEELAAEIAKIAQGNKLEPAEVRRRLVQNGTLEGLRAGMREDKALEFVVDRAKTP